MKYTTLYLERQYKFVENDDIFMTFLLLGDEEIIEDLTNYRFRAELTNDAEEVKLRDATHAEGSDDQIKIDGKQLIVHIDKSDTDTFEGDYDFELEMEDSNGDIFTVAHLEIEFREEIVDWN